VASNHSEVVTKVQRLVEQHRATVMPVKNQLADPPAPKKAATAAAEKGLLSSTTVRFGLA